MKHCIYHHPCSDGFAAAWTVRKFFKDEAVAFYPANYGQDVPQLPTDAEVIIVDFSYPRDVLIELAGRVKSILVLDHHKTAQEQLIDLPSNVEVVFDMERSGCMITWDYFFPDEACPMLMAYIEDRDLWRFNYRVTKAVNAALRIRQFDFKVWDDLMIDGKVHQLKIEGYVLAEQESVHCEQLIKMASFGIELNGHRVLCVQCPPWLSSEIGNRLVKEYGQPFGMTYYDSNDGFRRFSLRSTDNHVDVSEIAKDFGGGGHRNAAGFSIKRKPEIL